MIFRNPNEFRVGVRLRRTNYEAGPGELVEIPDFLAYAIDAQRIPLDPYTPPASSPAPSDALPRGVSDGTPVGKDLLLSRVAETEDNFEPVESEPDEPSARADGDATTSLSDTPNQPRMTKAERRAQRAAQGK